MPILFYKSRACEFFRADYRRGDLLEKRRELMRAWGTILIGPTDLPVGDPDD